MHFQQRSFLLFQAFSKDQKNNMEEGQRDLEDCDAFPDFATALYGV